MVVSLDVTEAPPRFVRLISDYSTFVGASVCFQCLVTGSPRPSVRWYKDGVLLEGDRYCAQEEQNGLQSLTIEHLIQSDSGQYKCIATNRAGTAETCAVAVIPALFNSVVEPAKIIEKAEIIQVTAGEPAILEYTVTGTPELKTKWFKDGKPLPTSKKYRISFKNNIAQLKFYATEMQDSGEYTFEISNDVGISSCTTSFTVLGQSSRKHTSNIICPS
uniref:Ig-like domain-containing protein n=1 Tax=Ficedula albicollis TaxID=59894 RepID=A0A803VWG0_FICAL